MNHHCLSIELMHNVDYFDRNFLLPQIQQAMPKAKPDAHGKYVPMSNITGTW